MEERIVIVAYKPKSGKSEELEKLVKEHYLILKKEGLVSDREPIIAKSSESIAQAHENKTVQKLWENFANVCEYVPVSKVSEAENLFSEFKPMN